MGYAQSVGTGDEFAAVPQRDSGSHGLQVEAQGNDEDPRPDYIFVSHALFANLQVSGIEDCNIER